MIGKTLAHYEITDLLGKGGMGEVYRARDTRLGREVAIKVLPAELSGDPERAARFEREARTLASLQHPNVASIYGFEEADGVRFLVMELVEGRDLSTRIAAGALPVEEVIRIAREIATGLEAAHERGIVHRDLKPANIMLDDSGAVKILDFGLARAWFGDTPEDADLEHSPTITAAMTQAGVVLGTAAYMSPEQARGRTVDRRADIWAFGAILYEMVTGRRLFEGETVSDTFAAVLREEPDWDRLPQDEAPHLCLLIRRCLVRDPRQRLRDIGEARILLQDDAEGSSILSLPAAAAPETAAARPGIRRPVVAAIALVMLAVGILAGWKLLHTAPERALIHAIIPAPEGTQFDMEGGSPGPPALSPDGTMVAFSAAGEDGVVYLYLRRLDSGEAVRLSGTEDAAYPFWSPNSDFIGFFSPSQGKLRKVAVGGGPPVTLCAADNGKGASWNRDGVIIFAPTAGTGIHRVPSIGGEPEQITQLAGEEDSHRHPRFLPNGRDFLFTVRHGDEFTIRMGSLDGREPIDVTDSECHADFAAGRLFTAREGVLFATAFDPETGTLSGGGVPLVEQVLIAGRNAGAGSYSVLSSGMMVYQTGVAESDRVLSSTDLETGQHLQIGAPGQMYYPSISPDGSSCVVEVEGESQEGRDLWLVDLATGLRTRFTFENGEEIASCWTPDGSAVVYTSRYEGKSRIMRRPVEGTAGAEQLYEAEVLLFTTSVHPDGSGVLFTRQIPDSSEGTLEFLRFDGESDPTVITQSRNIYGGRYSPGGRWIAYGQASAAAWDVFVMPASGGPRKWQITSTGAVWPQWQADGTRLFVSDFSGNVLAYDVNPTGDSFRFGSAQQLVTVETPTPGGCAFSVHPDGTRIIHAGPDPGAARDTFSPIHLVTDWRRALSQ